MKRFYFLLSFILCLGVLTGVKAQDSTGCNATFQAIPSGYQVVFFPADSMPGVVHRWNFGDSSQKVTDSSIIFHQFVSSGTFLVTQVVIDSTHHCQLSASQYVTIFSNPTPSCGVAISLSSDSSRHQYTFVANTSVTPGGSDTVTWKINEMFAGHGDTLRKYLIAGPASVCAYLRTSDGCDAQNCVTVDPEDSIGLMPPPPPDTCAIAFSGVNSHHSNEFSFLVTESAKYDSINWEVFAPDSVLEATFRGSEFEYSFPDTGYYTVFVAAKESQACPVVNSWQFVHVDSIPATQGDAIVSYPNPATTTVTLNLTLATQTPVTIRLYNSMGTLVSTRMTSGNPGLNQLVQPVGNLPIGVYYIEVQYGASIKRSKIQKL